MWTRKEQERVVSAYKRARAAFLRAIEVDGSRRYRSHEAQRVAKARIERLRLRLSDARFDVDNIANQMGDVEGWYKNWDIEPPARGASYEDTAGTGGEDACIAAESDPPNCVGVCTAPAEPSCAFSPLGLR